MSAFERQKNESAKAFEAFRVYCELGAKRSLAAVGHKLGKSTAICERWSARHKWRARVKKYDESLLMIEQAAIEKTAAKGAVDWQKERNRIRLEALENSKLLIEKAKQMLQFPLATTTIRNGLTVVNPARWSMTDAVKFVEVADKLQRLAAEMETSNDKVTITVDEQAKETAILALMAEAKCTRDEAIATIQAIESAKEKVNGYVN